MCESFVNFETNFDFTASLRYGKRTACGSRDNEATSLRFPRNLAIPCDRYPIFQLSLSRFGIVEPPENRRKGASVIKICIGWRRYLVFCSCAYMRRCLVLRFTMDDKLWGNDRVQYAWCERMSLSGLTLAFHRLARCASSTDMYVSADSWWF